MNVQKKSLVGNDAKNISVKYLLQRDSLDGSEIKKFSNRDDINLADEFGEVLAKISNVNVSLLKPDPEWPSSNTVVVSFDTISLADEHLDSSYWQTIDIREAKPPSLYFSFSTNQETHPENADPLKIVCNEKEHTYYEEFINPSVYGDDIEVFLNVTEGTLYSTYCN